METFKVFASKSYTQQGDGEIDLVKGETYTVVEVKNDMYRLKNEAGDSGWAPLDHFEVLEKAQNDEVEKICRYCNDKITGTFVTTKNENFHTECFHCSECKRSLGGKVFFKDGDNVVCESCHKKKSTMRCGKCNEILTSSYITALGKTWHPEHFCCEDCGKPNEKTFHNLGDKAYCSECFSKQITTNCHKCKKIIKPTDKRITLSGNDLHLKCFYCSYDGKQLKVSENIKIKDDKYYCEEHYYEHIVKKCSVCKEKIIGTYVNVLNKDFHSECLKCEECGESASEDTKMAKGKILCSKCGERFSSKMKKLAEEEEKQKEIEMENKRKEEEKQKEIEMEKKRKEEEKQKEIEMENKRKEEEKQKEIEMENKRKEEEKQKEIELENKRKEEEKQKEIEMENKRKEEEKLQKEKEEKKCEIKEKYTLEELLDQKTLPKCFNLSRIEEFLHQKEFDKLFEMELKEFKKLPLWKQKAKKIKLNLM